MEDAECAELLLNLHEKPVRGKRPIYNIRSLVAAGLKMRYPGLHIDGALDVVNAVCAGTDDTGPLKKSTLSSRLSVLMGVGWSVNDLPKYPALWETAVDTHCSGDRETIVALVKEACEEVSVMYPDVRMGAASGIIEPPATKALPTKAPPTKAPPTKAPPTKALPTKAPIRDPILDSIEASIEASIQAAPSSAAPGGVAMNPVARVLMERDRLIASEEGRLENARKRLASMARDIDARREALKTEVEQHRSTLDEELDVVSKGLERNYILYVELQRRILVGLKRKREINGLLSHVNTK